MEEEARRIVKDTLKDHDDVEATLLNLAGVVDRHKEEAAAKIARHKKESEEAHKTTRNRVESVNRLAITIGTSLFLLLAGSLIGVWIR